MRIIDLFRGKDKIGESVDDKFYPENNHKNFTGKAFDSSGKEYHVSRSGFVSPLQAESIGIGFGCLPLIGMAIITSIAFKEAREAYFVFGIAIGFYIISLFNLFSSSNKPVGVVGHIVNAILHLMMVFVPLVAMYIFAITDNLILSTLTYVSYVVVHYLDKGLK